MQLGGFVKRCTRYNVTSFVRISRPSDPLQCLTFWRNLGTFDRRSRDCDSRDAPETDPCASQDDNHYDDPCSPCPPSEPPCPPEPPSYKPHSDPRKFRFFRILSLCVAVPLLVVMSAVTYVRERERLKQPREPFLNLPYMCRRTKPFPWGDGNHTLFHNPVKNPVPPHGYEVEDPNAIRKKADN